MLIVLSLLHDGGTKMFEVGDKVNVNLPQGTKPGEITRVVNPPRGHEYYKVQLDEAIQIGPLLIDNVVANPWDLFLQSDERTE